MKRIYAYLLFVLMCGCASQPVQTSYDQLTQARIRVYKGSLTFLVQDETGTPKLNIQATQRVQATQKTVPNHTLCMPLPKNIPHQSFLDRLAHQFGFVPYNEYTVYANESLKIVSSVVTPNDQVVDGFVFHGEPHVWCGVTVEFMPQAGKDYDVYFEPYCQFHLREFVTENGELAAVPISYAITSEFVGPPPFFH